MKWGNILDSMGFDFDESQFTTRQRQQLKRKLFTVKILIEIDFQLPEKSRCVIASHRAVSCRGIECSAIPFSSYFASL